MGLFEQIKMGSEVLDFLGKLKVRSNSSAQSWKQVLKSQFHEVLAKFTGLAEDTGAVGSDKKDAVKKLIADWYDLVVAPKVPALLRPVVRYLLLWAADYAIDSFIAWTQKKLTPA